MFISPEIDGAATATSGAPEPDANLIWGSPGLNGKNTRRFNRITPLQRASCVATLNE
jgi:hypothetical protein